MPHKGASTQCHNQQVLAKPCHQPSNRDQQAREKLQQKAKIKSQAYIQLGEEALQTVHRTFQPDIPVILHLLALADSSLDSNSTSTPTLFVIQEGLNCLETTDYFFTNIEPAPIIVKCSAIHQNKPKPQQATNGDLISQQTHPLQPGKMRIYPSVLTNRQKPVLNLTETNITRMHLNLFVCAPMVEKKVPKTKVQSDQLSDSDTPDEEVDPQLRTSEEERIYRMIRGSTQATQAALSHTKAQSNPTVERSPPQQPKIKKLSKDRAAEKATQAKDKEKPM